MVDEAMTAPEEQAAEVLLADPRFRGSHLVWDIHTTRVIAAALAPLFAEERRKGAEQALQEAAHALDAQQMYEVANWLRERADTYAEGGGP